MRECLFAPDAASAFVIAGVGSTTARDRYKWPPLAPRPASLPSPVVVVCCELLQSGTQTCSLVSAFAATVVHPSPSIAVMMPVAGNIKISHQNHVGGPAFILARHLLSMHSFHHTSHCRSCMDKSLKAHVEPAGPPSRTVPGEQLTTPSRARAPRGLRLHPHNMAVSCGSGISGWGHRRISTAIRFVQDTKASCAPAAIGNARRTTSRGEIAPIRPQEAVRRNATLMPA